MPAAILAQDFSSPAVSIGLTTNGTFNFVIETWPATARMKLGGRLIERRIAASTNVSAGRIVVVELARAGTFGTLVLDDVRFLVIQFVVLGHGDYF